MKDPRIAASGVLMDVAQALAFDTHSKVQVLQARLRGTDSTTATLNLTIRTPDMEKSVIEFKLRPETFAAVNQFFDRQANLNTCSETALPAIPLQVQLLEIAEDVAAQVGQRQDWKGVADAQSQSLGDAIGVAILLNDEPRACALVMKLKELLRLDGEAVPSPRCFLNAIGPALRAAIATDQMELLDRVLSVALPTGYRFQDFLSPEADLSRFAEALRELMEDRGLDEAIAFLENFQGPNITLRLLNEAVDACVKRGSAQSINTCAIAVRTLLPDCESADLFVNEAGIRLRAFEAALSGDWAAADRSLDDMPRWSRSDPLIGWLGGYVVGLKVRSDHDLAPAPAVNNFNTLLLPGNDEHFEHSAAQFVRGLVAATQGRNGDTSEPILQSIEDQHVTLEKMPEFLSARFAHQLVVASRSRSAVSVEGCLQDLVCTAQVLGDDGDALLTAMCEDLCSDVTIRDSELRGKIATTIAGTLRDQRNIGRFEGTRLLAGAILFEAGFSKAALRAPPSLVVGESGRLVWHLRAMDAKSREAGRPSAAKLEQLERNLDGLITSSAFPAAEWAAVVEEAAAVARGLPMALKALTRATSAAAGWGPADLGLLNEALFNGTLRRVKSLR